MSSADWTEILLFVACLLLFSPFLGRYCYDVFMGHDTFLSRHGGGVERLLYRVTGVNPQEEMSWRQYARALLLFNAFGMLGLFALQLGQAYLPGNPQHFPGVPWLMALNTAASFVSGTGWQTYAGETTLSYLTQMAGIAVQNFLSTATGLAVLVAFIRGLLAKKRVTIGNFWVDLVRGLLYILLPISMLLALLLISQGVVQTFHPYVQAITLEGDQQTIPLGPVASQVAIKQLGANGGGFFNANSSHPFENPTRLSNFLETWAMMLLPAALPFTFSYMVHSKKQGWLLFLVMFSLWGGGFMAARLSEDALNPTLGSRSWLEGKEQRFGMTRSVLWFHVTAATGNGSVNADPGSFKPLPAGIGLLNILLGELTFGGVGTGLNRLLIFTLLSLFLAGMIVGRTPTYFGKSLGKKEMQWVMVALLVPAALILFGAVLSCTLPEGRAAISSKGPRALFTHLYTFASTVSNNGVSISELAINPPLYQFILSLTMILGRLSFLIPSLALAGSLANKSVNAYNLGTLSTNSTPFSFLLVSAILLIGLVTYLPALCLGPILEHFLMMRGDSF